MKHNFLQKGLIALAVTALFGAAACTSAPEKGPEKVAKQAVEAIQKGDFDAYAATFDMSESDQKMLAGMIEEKAKEQIDNKGGIKDYEILETTVDEEGAKATVKVKINYKDGSDDTQTMNFVKKEDGQWLQKLVK